MDDKKFEEIMHKYVSSQSRGMESDFKKLENNEKIGLPKKSQYKLLWASLSCVIVVAISLAIALPLILQPSNSEPINPSPMINYCSPNDIKMIYVDSSTDIAADYNIFADMPTIAYQDIGKIVLKSNIDGSIIGAYLELSVFDDYFDDINIRIISENNVLSALSSYDALVEEKSWRGSLVKYNVEYNESAFNYNARIYFAKGGYKYYLDMRYYEDLEIDELLNLIY